jgi:beta-1,4-N-acetylglucosaminyltransferase
MLTIAPMIRELDDAVKRSLELVVQGRLDHLAPYTAPPFPVPEDERVTIFDWMVLTCYPEEFERQAHLAELRKPAAMEPAQAPPEPNSQVRLRMD